MLKNTNVYGCLEDLGRFLEDVLLNFQQRPADYWHVDHHFLSPYVRFWCIDFCGKVASLANLWMKHSPET